MIDKLHLIEDDQEYLEAIKEEMLKAYMDGMNVEDHETFDAVIIADGYSVQEWFNKKWAELSDAINGMTDPDLKDALRVLQERFRLYTFIASRKKRPTEESRDEYYRRKKQEQRLKL